MHRKEVRSQLGLPLVAQTVENLPAMQETQLPSLGWEDSLEKGMAIPVFLPENFHGQKSLVPTPSPGDLPNPGIEPGSPALQAGSLLAELPGKPQFWVTRHL